MAITEVLVIDDRLRDLILGGASTSTLAAAAREAGMRTLRESGLEAVFAGQTSVEEVLREVGAG
jgi:type IV pilus assembly protein PilB